MAESNDGDAARDRHAAWFADPAEQVFKDFRSPREALAYAFVDGEIGRFVRRTTPLGARRPRSAR